MGFVINLKAETGLVDRSENTTRFYKDIKDYQWTEVDNVDDLIRAREVNKKQGGVRE